MKAYRGSFVNPISLNNIDYIDDGLIVIENGVILKFITDSKQIDEYISQLNSNIDTDIRVLSKNEFIIPGFIDTHTHAPQFLNLGVGSELELIEWLQKYIYPSEKLFQCSQLAQNNYKLAVDLTVNNGTTTCLWNDTIFADSSLLLCDIIERKGQRGLVGKVCMDNSEFCPNYYVETSDNSLAQTKQFVSTIAKKHSPLICPVITPRSALSCTQLLMRQLSDLAKHNNLLIQSHLCESVNGCDLVRKRFPQYNSCVQVFQEFGLLNSNSVMAHCIHLTDDDCRALIQNNVGIAHCPSSNANLRSGRMPLRRYIDMGLKVGLGTDVSGGSSPSILRVIQDAYLIHKLANVDDKHNNFVTYEQLFYLATIGGAKVLNMDTMIGNFQTNKLFDALIIKIDECKLTRLNNNTSVLLDRITTTTTTSTINFNDYSLKELFEIFILNGSENDIINVIVNGNIIK